MACTKGFGATMFNSMCLMNGNYKQEIPKKFMHWHFVPRYKTSVKFHEVNCEDLEFGTKFNWEKVFGSELEKINQTKDFSPEFRQKIIKQIKRYLA